MSFPLSLEDSANDQLFYVLPKFVHHAGEASRQALTDYYDVVLPREVGKGLERIIPTPTCSVIIKYSFVC